MTNDLSNAQWFKSSYSGAGGDCVEVAWLKPDHIGVRDSKDPAGPALIFHPMEWSAFTTLLRTGRFGAFDTGTF
ncbi:DUF397 domain-containing protein [Nocardia carnea]|uniref:DUF397 domain-containing protein n=1 Tax=Nocardia carnea TaxID=37328 RepID=UPI0024541B4F|nr:DUF397 domain-containing protein [Nocardia carnea]